MIKYIFYFILIFISFYCIYQEYLDWKSMRNVYIKHCKNNKKCKLYIENVVTLVQWRTVFVSSILNSIIIYTFLKLYSITHPQINNYINIIILINFFITYFVWSRSLAMFIYHNISGYQAPGTNI